VNGAHDLGGMHGFGPVVAEADEPWFHAAWERRAFALTLAMGAWRRWNLDMTRSAREQMPPAEYLATSYYEHWLYGLERMLVEHGFVRSEELAATAARPDPSQPPALQAGALRASDVPRLLGNSRGARRAETVAASFAVGDCVRARNSHPTGHTRVPRYVRGRCGTVAIAHGVFVFPDSHAAGEGEQPQHVYAVRFAAQELWGPAASPRDSVYVDLWDSYLEAA
jgi:nitrile hydratase beta subunit